MIKTLKDINWNQFYYFFEVARRGSIKKASDLLNVSPPTISEQIKSFEKLIGQTLFHRYPRKMKLTEVGENLFVYAKEIFETGTRFLDSVSASTFGGYSVRVGVQETISAPTAIQFVTKYWDTFAPYGVVSTYRETLSEQLLKKIIAGDFDWGISLEPPKSQRFNWAKIAESEVVFCCSPEIFKRFKQKEDILRLLPLARSSWDRIINQKVDDHLHEAKIFPEEMIESDHREFCINLAQRGRCVAVFSRDTVENSSWKDSVKIFTIGKTIHVPFYAIWKQANERMISIKKLRKLLSTSGYPKSYSDPELQIKVVDIPNEKLVKSL